MTTQTLRPSDPAGNSTVRRELLRQARFAIDAAIDADSYSSIPHANRAQQALKQYQDVIAAEREHTTLSLS